jgi:hypothetical protein
MKRPWLRAVRALLIIGVLLLVAAIALAHLDTAAALQPPSTSCGTGSAGYDLAWWTVDGGGTTFADGSGYVLGGTIGQPDAGVLGYGIYMIRGGFWQSSAVTGYVLYLPLAMRN